MTEFTVVKSSKTLDLRWVGGVAFRQQALQELQGMVHL